MSYPTHIISQRAVEWAAQQGAVITDGECGFGRSCVGLQKGNSWVYWRYHEEHNNWKPIEPFYDGPVPDGAYHKSDLVCVLESEAGGDMWHQLARWIDDIIMGNWKIGMVDTHATGLQAFFSGLQAPILVKE